jgi:hypothetical protein
MPGNGKPLVQRLGGTKLSGQPIGVILLEPSGVLGVMFEPKIIEQLDRVAIDAIAVMVQDYLLRAKGLR